MWNNLRHDRLAMACGTSTFTTKFLSGFLVITVLIFLVSFSTTNWVTSSSERSTYLKFGIWRACYGNDSFDACDRSNAYLENDIYENGWLSTVQALLVLTLLTSLFTLTLVLCYLLISTCQDSNGPVFVALSASFVCVILTLLIPLVVGVNQAKQLSGSFHETRLDWSFVLCCLCSFFFLLCVILLMIELCSRTKTQGNQRIVARLNRQAEAVTFSTSRGAGRSNGHVPTTADTIPTPTSLFQANGHASGVSHEYHDNKPEKAAGIAEENNHGTPASLFQASGYAHTNPSLFQASGSAHTNPAHLQASGSAHTNPLYLRPSSYSQLSNTSKDYPPAQQVMPSTSVVDETVSDDEEQLRKRSSLSTKFEQTQAKILHSTQQDSPRMTVPSADENSFRELLPRDEAPAPRPDVFGLFQAKPAMSEGLAGSSSRPNAGALGALPPLEPPSLDKKKKKKRKKKKHNHSEDMGLAEAGGIANEAVQDDIDEEPKRPTQLQPEMVDSDEDF